MTLFENKKLKNISNKKGIITIGVFDSVHKGHQKIFDTLLTKAKELDRTPYLLTFKNQKLKKFPPTMSLEKRLQLINNYGIQNIIICEFNDTFQHKTADDFIQELQQNFNIDSIILGNDFKFGYNRSGDIDTFKKKGFNTFVVEPVYYNDNRISTSLIKELIIKGDIDNVSDYTGRNFTIEGLVEKGKQLGRVLGFPTMNIYIKDRVYPETGTFYTKTKIEKKEYFSMTYVNKNVIETYVLDYNIFRYNFLIDVEFIKKIRNNIRFDNLDELKQQLEKDCNGTKYFFNTYK